MALVLHAYGAFACYTSDQFTWRNDDYRVLQFVRSLKGEPFKGFAKIKGLDGRTRTINVPDSPAAFETFGLWGADVLNRFASGPVTIIPVPSSKHTDFNEDFVPHKLARAVKALSGNNVKVLPALAFKAAMEKSHAGGTRHQPTIYENLKCSATKVNGQVVLLDDMLTTGSHMRACADFMRQRGAKIDIAISAGRAVWSKVVDPFKLGPEDLEGIAKSGD